MAEELTQRTVPESIDIEENILGYSNWDIGTEKRRVESQRREEEVLAFK